MESIKNNNASEQPQINTCNIKENNSMQQNEPKSKELDNKYSFELKKIELEYDKINKEEQIKLETLRTLLNGQEEKLKLIFEENIKRIEADLESIKIKNKKKLEKIELKKVEMELRKKELEHQIETKKSDIEKINLEIKKVELESNEKIKKLELESNENIKKIECESNERIKKIEFEKDEMMEKYKIKKEKKEKKKI